MRVLGFAGGGHARGPAWRAALYAAGAAAVFDDMRQLRGLIDPPAPRDILRSRTQGG